MKNEDIRIEDKIGDVPFFISRLYEEIKKTTPHIHENYYELIFLCEGEGFHWIETSEYMITAPEFYFLKPNQLHHWEFTSIPRGYVVLFKSSYFDNVSDFKLINMYWQLADIFRIGIGADCSLVAAFESLLDAFINNSEFSIKIIQGYLMAVFAKMLQLAAIQAVEKQKPMTLCDQFIELVFKECPKLHNVIDFAKLLHTTPQNINSSCRKHSGKSAGEHISSQLMLEAKRYLLHSENSMSEIAYKLSFNDTSYFVKFFKKQEGITPMQFRKNHFQ